LKIKTGETQERSPERQRLISLSSSFKKCRSDEYVRLSQDRSLTCVRYLWGSRKPLQ
jgi:hypothetical protein